MRLQEALAAHGVETRLSDMTVGPTVTRYALQLGEGVKVARITSLHKDIAYALAAADVRILAPIPGQQAIGIEVPNDDREVVALGDILTSGEATKAKHPLEVGVGRDINGKSVMLNLATMPHLLIAGATGAGKSSCINSLVSSVLMRTTPEQAKLILIDPKRVEMGQYEGVPHLLTEPVTDPRKAANALNWAVKEMERRYDLLSSCGFRDITGYNAAHARGDLQAPLGVMDENEEPLQYKHLPFILVVVDELADLMMVAARDVEDSICRLAQMARAVGIHLVVATQRPSVNVITGVIKANIPARLAFAVSSLADSRVILDQPGAERLVGKGDMLLLGPSSSTPQRIQGAWVDEEEVRQIVTTWVKQVEAQGEIGGVENEDVTAEQKKSISSISPIGGEITDSITADPSPAAGSDDELYEQARRLVVESQLGSTSMLQRKLRVGFARAGRLMDLLEESGIVGPSIGSKAREVLITAEELNNLQEQGL
jgi:S-DNA-T family DNA segregation ATPase FtsK/SpoIIIE